MTDWCHNVVIHMCFLLNTWSEVETVRFLKNIFSLQKQDIFHEQAATLSLKGVDEKNIQMQQFCLFSVILLVQKLRTADFVMILS